MNSIYYLLYTGHLQTFFTGKVMKRVMTLKNVFVSGGQISKSFLVGYRHGQVTGSMKKVIQLR